MLRYTSFILMLLTSACGVNSVEQTLEAENSALGTQISDLRQTATADTDRMLITVEHAQTEVRGVQNQGTAAAATLVASGADPNVLNALQAAPGALPPTPRPEAPAVVNPPVSTEEAAVPQSITPTGLALPVLSNIVMAEGVGSNDCALRPVSQFTTNSPAIYVVAVASNITPGTKITSRWQFSRVLTFDFVPDFFIAQACVWFFVDQTDIVFTPGTYSVSLEINDQPTGQTATFTITG